MIEAYEVDGIWFWKSNDAPVPVDSAAQYNIPIGSKQLEAVRSFNQKMIQQYREAQKNRVRSLEELSEMRAAFGEGTKVVDVFTGQVTQL